MFFEDLDQQIVQRGSFLFEQIKDKRPSLFDKKRWIGRMMHWMMSNEDFKNRLFAFISVFPSIKTGQSLMQHFREYFPENSNNMPVLFKPLLKIGTYGLIGNKIFQKLIAFNIKTFGKQFIIGENASQAMATLQKLREKGYASTVAALGEATLTKEEELTYQQTYLKLLDDMAHHKYEWTAFPMTGLSLDCAQDWGSAPIMQLSIKLSGLFSKINAMDFENSVDTILERLKPIYRKVIQLGGTMSIDMEKYQFKNITLEVFRRLRSDNEFKDYPHLGIVLQAYLKDTPADLSQLIEWGKMHQLPFQIRLVKGAYWDYEVIFAQQHGWEPPVWLQKAQTDAAFESLAREILRNANLCYFACGSHNIRSIATVWETAKDLGVSPSRYEFQFLYGMAEPIAQVVKEEGGHVRFYCPYGDIVAGMGYLIRRLIENTANQSFLRHSFVENLDTETLLQNPKKLVK